LGNHLVPDPPRPAAVKILYLITTLATGGAELHLLALARALKADGFDIVVAYLHADVPGSRPLLTDFAAAGIRVVDLGGRQRLNALPLQRLLALIRRERPDILHSHLVRADLLAALATLFVPDLPIVSTVHGIYRDRWFGPWARPLLRWMLRRAVHLIAVSGTVRTWLAHDFGIDSSRIRVVHHGIDSDAFSPSAPLTRASNTPVIGAAGRLHPVKGFQYLVDAVAQLRIKSPGVTVRIAGYDAGYGAQLASQIQRLQLTEHIQLAGFQTNMPSFLGSLDIFAMPSLSEGLGQVAIEAMAAGLPVVATDLPALAELILPGQTGLLVPKANPSALAGALAWLLEHPDESAELGRRAQDRARTEFTIPMMVEAVEDVYARVIASPSSVHA
jgi:glycosyltransferase involved in cell wall biosynthesis